MNSIAQAAGRTIRASPPTAAAAARPGAEGGYRRLPLLPIPAVGVPSRGLSALHCRRRAGARQNGLSFIPLYNFQRARPSLGPGARRPSDSEVAVR